MAYYNVCPECGAYLDPGERCSCVEEQEIKTKKEKEQMIFFQKNFYEERSGQLKMVI